MRHEALNVEPDSLQEFRNAVFLRHGSLWGYMRREASQALRERAQQLLKEAGKA